MKAKSIAFQITMGFWYHNALCKSILNLVMYFFNAFLNLQFNNKKYDNFLFCFKFILK